MVGVEWAYGFIIAAKVCKEGGMKRVRKIYSKNVFPLFCKERVPNLFATKGSCSRPSYLCLWFTENVASTTTAEEVILDTALLLS